MIFGAILTLIHNPQFLNYFSSPKGHIQFGDAPYLFFKEFFMANWFANRLYIKASKENMAAVKKLMLGEIPLYFEEAIRKSIKFFIAGHAGIVKSVPSFDQQLNQTGDPSESDGNFNATANLAFSKWFSRLVLNCPLSKGLCEEINQLYEQSGLADCSIASLTDYQVQIINGIFDKQAFDWFGVTDYDPKDIEKYWTMLDGPTVSTINSFDFRLLIAPKIFPEIVGSNPYYFLNYRERASLSASNRKLYGVRTPRAFKLNLVDTCYEQLPDYPQLVKRLLAPNDQAENEAYVMVDFDTPDSKPKKAVFEALSKQFNCSLIHFYCEGSSKICGFDTYSNGRAGRCDSGYLLISGPDNDIFHDVIGPDYIIHNVAHYGG